MKISADTQRSEITVQGATFTAPEPYTEGHALTENEAAVLNQTLHENLRNNFAGVVKKALEEVEGKVDSLDMGSLQSQFDEYVTAYEFGVRRAGPRVPKDPVAHQAWKIASALVRKALAKKGIQVKELPEGKFDELVEGQAAKPEIVEAARQAVEALKSVEQLEVSTD